MGVSMDVVRIFDTTLRDGEQSPGFSMNTAEKIRMAHQLATLGVDVIEAGFPISSRGDLEAVRKVAQEVRTVPIAALARARKDDVNAAIEALEPAAAPRLHIFLATSDLHLRVKLHMTREQALEAIGAMIKLGRNSVGGEEFSAAEAGCADSGARRSAADRVHRQRHWRARGECGAGRNCGGAGGSQGKFWRDHQHSPGTFISVEPHAHGNYRRAGGAQQSGGGRERF